MIEFVDRHRDELRALCGQFGVRRLELFGSATSDRFDSNRSDLDFLVEFSSDEYEGAADRYFGLLHGLEDLFKRKVDLVSAKAVRNPYFRQVVESQRVLLYAA